MKSRILVCLSLVSVVALGGCNKTKSVEFYLADDEARSKTLARCGLAESSEDCANAREAAVQRTKEKWEEQRRINDEAVKNGAFMPKIETGAEK